MASPTKTRSLFPSPDSTVLEGVVQRVVFAAAERAWAVIRLLPTHSRIQVTVVGPLYGVQAGERLRLNGEWVEDPKFGRQFQVHTYLSLQPNTLHGIERYLGSGLIPGIGAVMAKRLVERFGLQTLDVIEHQPERLTEVAGIGSVRVRRIQQGWQKQRGIREILVFLQAHGITISQAVRIHKHYGSAALATVKANPYRLAEDIFGFGFQTADQIADKLGMARDAPARAQAGLVHTLTRATRQGHMFLPDDALVDQASELLNLPAEQIRPVRDRLVKQGEIVCEPPPADVESRACYLPRLLAAEVEIADRLHQLLAQPISETPRGEGPKLGHTGSAQELELSPLQHEAVAMAMTERVLVITGGPGTGKTTLIRTVVDRCTQIGERVLLAAPTGRAAKRLVETTGVEAKTIHRLLEFDAHGLRFQRHQDRPLDADLLIIDEASMLDAPLARHLLEATPNNCRLVLVGDVDQLPSVGPGRVLADLIAAERISVVRLQDVFRQAAESLIVANAHRIRRGLMPRLETDRPVDFYFIERQQPEDILTTLQHLVTERIPRRFGFDPRNEIQVLTPMRRGIVGVENLNLEMQQLLNPGTSALQIAGGRLRAGDRVMQIRNNYDLEVFNGDVGRIVGASPDDETVEVDFYGQRTTYSATELDQLVLAYACSIHKAQGSEYPCVVIPLHSQHYVMLQRNLLYTAVTRGRKLVLVVGEKKALAQAVRNDRPQERFTRLTERLQ